MKISIMNLLFLRGQLILRFAAYGRHFRAVQPLNFRQEEEFIFVRGFMLLIKRRVFLFQFT